MDELDEFLAWAKQCGHYPAEWLVKNFRQYKQNSTEANEFRLENLEDVQRESLEETP